MASLAAVPSYDPYLDRFVGRAPDDPRPETRFFDKLFGGPLHGRVITLSHKDATAEVSLGGATAYVPENGMKPPTRLSFLSAAYTRRVQSMNGGYGKPVRLIWFAYHTASEEKAREMLWNYLLRNSRPI